MRQNNIADTLFKIEARFVMQRMFVSCDLHNYTLSLHPSFRIVIRAYEFIGSARQQQLGQGCCASRLHQRRLRH
jgi:hypothetical protein